MMSPHPSWTITEVAHLDGERLLFVGGELDMLTAPRLADRLRALRLLGHRVTVDLAEVSFMDSNGLTALLDARVEAERDGVMFHIRNPSAPVRRIVELARAEALLGPDER